MLKPIPCHAKATIIVHRYPPYRGTLLECVRWWCELPAKDKTTTLIRLDPGIFGDPVLNLRAIQKLTEEPEFFSL
jgi:hypothetical protein